jgi:bifunctional DNase/RNase
MWLKVGDSKSEVDARPSDAITLALQAGAPIYVAPETLEENETAITAGDELVKLNEQWKTLEQTRLEPEVEPMEYRSVRGLVREAFAKPASD